MPQNMLLHSNRDSTMVDILEVETGVVHETLAVIYLLHVQEVMLVKPICFKFRFIINQPCMRYKLLVRFPVLCNLNLPFLFLKRFE